MPGRLARREPDSWPRCQDKRKDGKVCGQFLPKGWQDGDYCPTHTLRAARELLDDEALQFIRSEITVPAVGKPPAEFTRVEWEATRLVVTGAVV